MTFEPLWLVYLLPLIGIWAYIQMRAQRRTQASLSIKQQAEDAGLVEPPSLHPVIDFDKCIGCGSCVAACPEKTVLGLIDGKAHLLEPTLCIGHGACAAACPTEGIDLVFGTETRGVDIPHVTPTFETNIPGIFIAGELGGMGLVRNAVEQGRQALDAVFKQLAAQKTKADAEIFDLIIVGAGPAGISASLGAVEKGLRYCTIEQDTMGGTVAHYPRGKLVMTAPAILPLIGKTKFGEVRKEELLEFWSDAVEKYDLNIRYQEQILSIVESDRMFHVQSSRGSYKCRKVLLTIGRRGTPRTLDVAGEDLSKVAYRLVDANEFQGKHMLVVGGGDSALEAACSLAEQPGNNVTLSYRGNAFSRARQKNRDRVAKMEDAGTLTVLMNSTVKEIDAGSVTLAANNDQCRINNDGVIVCAGGILPTGFLNEIGIKVERKFGTR